MKKKPVDFLVGLVIIAVLACLFVFLAGARILVYIGWAIACGVAVIFLLKLKRMDSTVIATILNPAVLLRYFLPKRFRTQLKDFERKDDISRRP
ncbi:hypothetical protein LJR289_000513 [Pseudoduganella sp. LjRoot289]|uniref:hypothetical protein n=1 Tax=Pseudoduganella sp. LjRoot289 TaxID=3342314 RepID=UPI003ED036A4